MYQKIADEIKNDYYVKNYPNEGQRFVAWYLRNIHKLDIVEAKDCVTDGAGDKQIDAVYIDNQASKIYIIQGKFYSGESVDAAPLREVLSSWVQIKDLQKLQEAANQKLKVKISEIATALEDDYELCFELITTAELTTDAKSDFEMFSKELAENESLSANLVLVDKETLKYKYEEALNSCRPYINHDFNLENGKFMELDLGGTKAVIAAIPLKECIKIPGIKDGSLFRKNVRQSLGTSNKVNKGIASTLNKEIKDFFFLHNGITAICSKIILKDGLLRASELNVVNGCQSLSTIFSCSEAARNSKDGYIMFRFYEITNSEKADKISNSTNSQSAVKARDLRSNDKAVLQMKRVFEQHYPKGYLITKRGETVDSTKYDTNYVINLTDLGKQLIAWHSQRPTISYSESKIFDKYFNQLFYKDYDPKKIQALNELYRDVMKVWTTENPLDMDETLLAMKSYAPHHHLYAISVLVSQINNEHEAVPNPAEVLKQLKDNDMEELVVKFTGKCLNSAFKNAASASSENHKVFVPQNWAKKITALNDIRSAIRVQLNVLDMLDEGHAMYDKFKTNLKLLPEDFEKRWTAD